LLMRAILGLEVDLDQGALCVAPAFPAWLSWVRVDGLEALGHRFDLEVTRDGAGYRVQSNGPVEEKTARRQVGKSASRLDG
jgi:hypothetical protein